VIGEAEAEVDPVFPNSFRRNARGTGHEGIS
jgi:hypothetical protein